MTGMIWPLVITLIVGGAVLRSVDEDAEIAVIRKMEQDRVQAGVRKDVDAISAVTAEEYLQIDFDGIVRDKSAAMQRIRSSAFQLQSNSLDEMVVRIYGNTAVVTARSTPRGTSTARTSGDPCATAVST